MPEISRFLGIVIAMYFKEHAPPHFHAKYEEQRAAFSILYVSLREVCRAESWRWCRNGHMSTEMNCWRIGSESNAARIC